MLNRGFILWVVCLCLGFPVRAQQEVPEKYLEIRGTSELEMEPLARATANLYEGSNKIKSIQTGTDGSFSFRLDINKQYTIEVEKDGLVSKRISFNTSMPDDEKGTWMNEFSIGLLKSCKNIDYAVLKEPVDKVSFDAKRREFISDKNYVNSMRPKIESLMMKTDECLLDSFEELVKKADQTARLNNYDEAINTYREALKIYPREEYPAKRIAELNAMVNKNQNSAEAYKKLITDADALSAQGMLAEALQKYKQAGTLNPQETYPKQKTTEIQTVLAQQQAAKQSLLSKEERYNQAMAKASVAYTKKDYSTAKQFYQEALDIKPAESLPKSRVQEIVTIEAKKATEETTRVAESAKKTAFEKEYQGLVTQADEQFKAKKYEEARASYAKALTMKPSESYPAQRVKVIEHSVAADQAALLKNKDEGYNTAMAAANTAIAKNQFQQAKDAYMKALTFKPDDVSAKSRIEEVDRLAEEYSKQKSQEEQYKNLIQSADALVAQKEWTKAKESYTKALTLKPGDKYAVTKITAIDNMVASEQAALQKTKNESYNAALSAGNNALAQNQFSIAKESYQKALSIKPDDSYAKDRMAETDKLAESYTKLKSLDDQYRKIIQTADGFLAEKESGKARDNYSQALALKPGDAYALSKITAIDNSVAAENAEKTKNIEEGYKAAIGGANTAIAQKSYTQAKEFLQKALTLKPRDPYATSKTNEVDGLIAEQQKKLEQNKQLVKQYNEAIAAADNLFNGRDFPGARNGYIKALQYKSGDPYANQKILSIESIMATELANKQKQTDEAFATAMNTGSNALLSKNYSAAREAFQQALAIRPGDNNAKQKFNDAELLIKQDQERVLIEQTRKKKYDEAIRTADQYFTQKNYSGAKASYEMALNMMPGENYPRLRLDESIKLIDEQEKILADQKARESAYSIALVNAEKYFKAKDYVQAKDEYGRALTLKPGETFPKARITEIENLILLKQKEQADAKSRTAAYTAAINAGNEAFSRKDYPIAKASYSEALKQMPGDLLAADQIKKIDYLISEAEKIRKEELARKTAYDNHIASADKSFDAARYAEAKENYKKALAIDPVNTYPKQRIARIDEINRLLSQSPAKTNTQTTAAVTPAVVAAIPMGDLNFKNESERQIYLDELKEKYPSGITLEKYKEQFKETNRYIIIRDNIAQEFRHVRFLTYNGAQYTVNGKPITQQYFLSQTKVRQGEIFKEINMQ